MHEQEYRKTIEQIEKDIDVNSTKPLQIIQEHDENALLLMGIDPSTATTGAGTAADDKLKAQKSNATATTEAPVNQKIVKAIHSTYDDLKKKIGDVQEFTAKVLMKKRE